MPHYGAEHRAQRAAWARKVEAGGVNCWRCGEAIEPGQTWDMGHDDQDSSQWRGPEHSKCNRSAGGKIGNRIARERREMVVRSWF